MRWSAGWSPAPRLGRPDGTWETALSGGHAGAARSWPAARHGIPPRGTTARERCRLHQSIWAQWQGAGSARARAFRSASTTLRLGRELAISQLDVAALLRAWTVQRLQTVFAALICCSAGPAAAMGKNSSGSSRGGAWRDTAP